MKIFQQEEKLICECNIYIYINLISIINGYAIFSDDHCSKIIPNKILYENLRGKTEWIIYDASYFIYSSQRVIYAYYH